ncbi:hypothetical protein ACROYT_G001682 [Oculina patagonica]
MASRALDDFENDWTFVDKDGKVDVEPRKNSVSYSKSPSREETLVVSSDLRVKDDSEGEAEFEVLSGFQCHPSLEAESIQAGETAEVQNDLPHNLESETEDEFVAVHQSACQCAADDGIMIISNHFCMDQDATSVGDITAEDPLASESEQNDKQSLLSSTFSSDSNADGWRELPQLSESGSFSFGNDSNSSDEDNAIEPILEEEEESQDFVDLSHEADPLEELVESTYSVFSFDSDLFSPSDVDEDVDIEDEHSDITALSEASDEDKERDQDQEKVEEVDDHLAAESSDDASAFYVDIPTLFVVLGLTTALGFSIGYGLTVYVSNQALGVSGGIKRPGPKTASLPLTTDPMEPSDDVSRDFLDQLAMWKLEDRLEAPKEQEVETEMEDLFDTKALHEKLQLKHFKLMGLHESIKQRLRMTKVMSWYWRLKYEEERSNKEGSKWSKALEEQLQETEKLYLKEKQVADLWRRMNENTKLRRAVAGGIKFDKYWKDFLHRWKKGEDRSPGVNESEKLSDSTELHETPDKKELVEINAAKEEDLKPNAQERKTEYISKEIWEQFQNRWMRDGWLDQLRRERMGSRMRAGASMDPDERKDLTVVSEDRSIATFPPLISPGFLDRTVEKSAEGPETLTRNSEPKKAESFAEDIKESGSENNPTEFFKVKHSDFKEGVPFENPLFPNGVFPPGSEIPSYFVKRVSKVKANPLAPTVSSEERDLHVMSLPDGRSDSRWIYEDGVVVKEIIYHENTKELKTREKSLQKEEDVVKQHKSASQSEFSKKRDAVVDGDRDDPLRQAKKEADERYWKEKELKKKKQRETELLLEVLGQLLSELRQERRRTQTAKKKLRRSWKAESLAKDSKESDSEQDATVVVKANPLAPTVSSKQVMSLPDGRSDTRWIYEDDVVVKEIIENAKEIKTLEKSLQKEEDVIVEHKSASRSEFSKKQDAVVDGNRDDPLRQAKKEADKRYKIEQELKKKRLRESELLREVARQLLSELRLERHRTQTDRKKLRRSWKAESLAKDSKESDSEQDATVEGNRTLINSQEQCLTKEKQKLRNLTQLRGEEIRKQRIQRREWKKKHRQAELRREVAKRLLSELRREKRRIQTEKKRLRRSWKALKREEKRISLEKEAHQRDREELENFMATLKEEKQKLKRKKVKLKEKVNELLAKERENLKVKEKALYAKNEKEVERLKSKISQEKNKLRQRKKELKSLKKAAKKEYKKWLRELRKIKRQEEEKRKAELAKLKEEAKKQREKSERETLRKKVYDSVIREQEKYDKEKRSRKGEYGDHTMAGGEWRKADNGVKQDESVSQGDSKKKEKQSDHAESFRQQLEDVKKWLSDVHIKTLEQQQIYWPRIRTLVKPIFDAVRGGAGNSEPREEEKLAEMKDKESEQHDTNSSEKKENTYTNHEPEDTPGKSEWENGKVEMRKAMSKMEKSACEVEGNKKWEMIVSKSEIAKVSEDKALMGYTNLTFGTDLIKLLLKGFNKQHRKDKTANEPGEETESTAFIIVSEESADQDFSRGLNGKNKKSRKKTQISDRKPKRPDDRCHLSSGRGNYRKWPEKNIAATEEIRELPQGPITFGDSRLTSEDFYEHTTTAQNVRYKVPPEVPTPPKDIGLSLEKRYKKRSKVPKNKRKPATPQGPVLLDNVYQASSSKGKKRKKRQHGDAHDKVCSSDDPDSHESIPPPDWVFERAKGRTHQRSAPWYVHRAEDREYQRNTDKHESQFPCGRKRKRFKGPLDPSWYFDRAEDRAYHRLNNEPWYTRRAEGREAERQKGHDSWFLERGYYRGNLRDFNSWHGDQNWMPQGPSMEEHR